jgi:coproporphyrinogen III oxidase-like Fe-S oxidoreductase
MTEPQYTSTHIVGGTPKPITIEEIETLLDKVFVEIVKDMEVGGTFVIDFQRIERVA